MRVTAAIRAATAFRNKTASCRVTPLPRRVLRRSGDCGTAAADVGCATPRRALARIAFDVAP